MTDWGVCEIDHVLWDVFDDNGFHMVPLRGAELDKPYEAQRESCKKGRNDANTVIERNDACSGLAARNSIQQDAGAAFHSSSLIGQPNVHECQRPYTSHNEYPLSCYDGCMANYANSASASAQWSNDCFDSHSAVTNSKEFCSNYLSLSSTVAFDESNLHPFSLGMSAANDDLDFLENESKCRQNGDILDYGWPETPDIGNFEDFEQIFSDPTNSRGCSGTMDELPWLSSSSIIGGSEDALKSTLQYSSSQSYGANLDTKNKEKLDFTSHNEVIPSMKLKQNQSQRKRKFSASESRNNGSHASDDLASPCKDERCPSFIASAAQTSFFQVEGSGDHCAALKGSLSPQRIPTARIKCRKDTKPFFFGKVSSQTLNDGYLSMTRTHDPSQSNSTLSVEKKVQEGYQLQQQQQLSQLNMSHAISETESQLIMYDQGSLDKNLHKIETVEGVKCRKKEASEKYHRQHNIHGAAMGSQNMSIGQTAIRQLQHAIKQLDVRTKLCIGDGLYRLARSAQERHGIDDTRPGCRERRNSSSVFGATHSRSAFMEGETATNAIDRSIAHLLFHRAPEYSPEDTVSLVTSEENCIPSRRRAKQSVFPEYLGKPADRMLLGAENY